MKNVQWLQLVYAIIAITALIGLGVSFSFQNILLTLCFLAIFVIFMALGFTRKRKLRETGKL